MNSLRFVSGIIFTLGCQAFAADPSVVPELEGILVIGNQQRFALVAPNGAHSGWVAVGVTFAGWKLTDYRAAENSLVLTGEGRHVTIGLRASAVRSGEAASAAHPTMAEADAMLQRMKFDAMWNAVVGEQRKAILSGMRQQAAPEFVRAGLQQNEVESLLEKMGDAVISGMQTDAIRKDFSRILSEVYTADELRGMADFYDSPAGRAWGEKQPEVQQKLMQAIMPRVMQSMPAAQQIATDYLRRRAIPSPQK